MKAFITGATGFIGAAIVRELLADNIAVRALVRPDSDTSNLRGLDVELWQGDLADPQTIANGIKGCNLVFHAAADYRLWTNNPVQMYRINVDGTKAVLQAAAEAEVERVIYTSSVGTLGNPGDGRPGTEDTPVTFDDMVGHYKKSKFLAEKVAKRFIEQGLPLVIVNPSTPIGPNDIKPTPTGKIIVDFLNRKMPAYLDTGLNLIAVEDCAKGHLLAAKSGRIGSQYILGNQNLTLREIFDILSDITGLTAPRVRLPFYPILAAAWVNEKISAITGKEPLIPLAGVQMAQKFMYFDSTRAVTELALPQTSVKDALARAVDWFDKNGYLNTKRGVLP